MVDRKMEAHRILTRDLARQVSLRARLSRHSLPSLSAISTKVGGEDILEARFDEMGGVGRLKYPGSTACFRGAVELDLWTADIPPGAAVHGGFIHKKINNWSHAAGRNRFEESGEEEGCLLVTVWVFLTTHSL